MIGALLGDGNIYDKRPHYVEMCGNPITDFRYYQVVLLPIVVRELGVSPRIVERSKGLRFRINSKAFVEWLKSLGIPAGEKKGYTVIPKVIAASKRLAWRCLRGIFDTDGSVYFDMRTKYKRPYARIELHMKNVRLMVQVNRLLRCLGIESLFFKRRFAVQLIGARRVITFLRNVGFSNEWNLKRLGKFYPELVELNRN